MKVTIKPLIGKSLIDPAREVRTRLYRIRVDGKHVGVVHHDPGSGIALHTRFSPIEVTEIENQVSLLKKDLSQLPTTAMPDDLPPEAFKRPSEDIDVDDFD